jgi:hypothetical protein
MTTKPRPGRKIKGLEKRVQCRLLLEPRIIQALDTLRGSNSRADTLQTLIMKAAERNQS